MSGSFQESYQLMTWCIVQEVDTWPHEVMITQVADTLSLDMKLEYMIAVQELYRHSKLWFIVTYVLYVKCMVMLTFTSDFYFFSQVVPIGIVKHFKETKLFYWYLKKVIYFVT